jgi:hypothetical protein
MTIKQKNKLIAQFMGVENYRTPNVNSISYLMGLAYAGSSENKEVHS